MNYWEECVRIGLEEAGINATDEQIDIITDSVKGGYENYGMAHGYDIIDIPSKSQAERELENLKRQIEKKRIWELSTKPCNVCHTTGTTKDTYGRDQTCDTCNGHGRI